MKLFGIAFLIVLSGCTSLPDTDGSMKDTAAQPVSGNGHTEQAERLLAPHFTQLPLGQKLLSPEELERRLSRGLVFVAEAVGPAEKSGTRNSNLKRQSFRQIFSVKQISGGDVNDEVYCSYRLDFGRDPIEPGTNVLLIAVWHKIGLSVVGFGEANEEDVAYLTTTLAQPKPSE